MSHIYINCSHNIVVGGFQRHFSTPPTPKEPRVEGIKQIHNNNNIRGGGGQGKPEKCPYPLKALTLGKNGIPSDAVAAGG